MNSILTCHDIIPRMYAWGNLIPILASVLVAILLDVIYNNSIFNRMRNAINVCIVKRRLSLFNIRNPCFHFRIVFSEIMIYVILRNFSHFLQRWKMPNHFSKCSLWLLVRENIIWSYLLNVLSYSNYKCTSTA